MVGVAFIDPDLMQDACNKVAIVAVFQLILDHFSNPRGPGGLYVCMLLSVIRYNILLGNKNSFFLIIHRAIEYLY